MIRYKINKISEIDTDQLSDFYKKTYYQRYKNLTSNWRWWYRVGYTEFEPLILSIDQQIIGQAGLLPVDLKIKKKIIKAIWFIDFVILPEFRSKGFGQILTKEWMKICPNQITLCNNQSLKVFQKFGWKNNLATKRLIRPINPLKFFPIIKKYNFNFTNKILRYFIKRKFNRNTSISPYKIGNNFKVIVESFKIKKFIKNIEVAEIIRDEKWLIWRLIECPYSNDIHFFEYNNNFAIVHIFSSNNIKRLNILYTYYTDEEQEDELLVLILNWAIKNNFDMVWSVSESKKFKNIFPKSLSKKLNFTTWSSDKGIFETLRKGLFDVQGIDSDIDSSLYTEPTT